MACKQFDDPLYGFFGRFIQNVANDDNFYTNDQFMELSLYMLFVA